MSDVSVPPEYECPITQEIMTDPVSTVDGQTYEKAAIEQWFAAGHVSSPVTGLPLGRPTLTPNIAMKRAIASYLESQPAVEARRREFSDLRAFLESREAELKDALARNDASVSRAEYDRLLARLRLADAALGRCGADSSSSTSARSDGCADKRSRMDLYEESAASQLAALLSRKAALEEVRAQMLIKQEASEETVQELETKAADSEAQAADEDLRAVFLTAHASKLEDALHEKAMERDAKAKDIASHALALGVDVADVLSEIRRDPTAPQSGPKLSEYAKLHCECIAFSVEAQRVRDGAVDAKKAAVEHVAIAEQAAAESRALSHRAAKERARAVEAEIAAVTQAVAKFTEEADALQLAYKWAQRGLGEYATANMATLPMLLQVHKQHVAVRDASIKATLKNLKGEGRSARQLATIGASMADLKDIGFTVAELRSCGFTAEECAQVGFTVHELTVGGFLLEDLKQCGCQAGEFMDAGLGVCDLMMAGFSAVDVEATGFGADELKESGFTAGALKGLHFHVDYLIRGGFSLRELRHGGFVLSDLKDKGYSVDDLMGSGFTAAELCEEGFPAADVKKYGVPLDVLLSAGFMASSLKECGFRAKDFKECGFGIQALAALGFVANEIVQAGYGAHDFETYASRLREDGKQLKDCGFSVPDLREVGFALCLFRDAGFGLDDLTTAGFSAMDLREVGFGARHLRAAGLTAKDLKTAGFTTQALKDGGFRLRELRASGFSTAEIVAGGFAAADLREGGFTAADLKRAGFVRHPVEILIRSNVDTTLRQLKHMGFEERDFCRAAADMKGTGSGAGMLKACGFAARHLKAAGFTAHELVEAGFSVADVREAGLSWVSLLEAGIPWPSLKENFFGAMYFKKACLTANTLAAASARAQAWALRWRGQTNWAPFTFRPAYAQTGLRGHFSRGGCK